jgi:SagB-type dehydrogenase family enzyme
MNSLAPFESSIAEHYHEATKYNEQGLRETAVRQEPLNWSERPEPFKRYGDDPVLLPSSGLPIQRRGKQSQTFPTSDNGDLDVERLARLLWCANGCTRIVPHPGGFQHFRAAPSAGAMYPTEMYVAVRDLPGLDDGLYDYHVLEHSLSMVRDGNPVAALESAVFGHPAVALAKAVVILTAEWYRSSWRYKERGYRRALLDTGHVLGNLVEAAPDEGMVALPIGSFQDRTVEKLIGVDPVEEGPLVLVALVTSEEAKGLPAIPARSSSVTEWHRAMATLGARIPADEPEGVIAALHLATRLDDDAAPLSASTEVAPVAPPSGTVAVDLGDEETTWSDFDTVGDTIAHRRSTRRFSPAPVARAPLFRALSHAIHGSAERLLAPDLLRTYLISMNVVGLPPGTYLCDGERLHELSRGQTAAAMLHLGLGQDIFVHAGAALVHTVDLTRAVLRYGDRAYRLAHLDAGHVGERLNLALLREGLGVSGCAGFYDDEMNRVLQIPESQAVLYITPLGVPG